MGREDSDPPPINSAEYEHKAATHRKRVAKFMSNPEPTHIAAAKRVLRYLAGTRSLGITYRRGAVDPSLLSVGVRTAPDQLSASSRPVQMQIMLERMITGVSADGPSCSLGH